MTLRLAPDPGLRRFADGRTLAGGSPFRILRLSAAGASLVDGWVAGEPVTAGATLAQRLVRAGMMHPRYDQARFRPEDVTLVLPVRDDHHRAPDSAIVVDDGSQPPVPGAAIRHETPRGPAAARNAGLRLVDTPLVAFLDADVSVEPGWLEPLLRHFEDPEVAAVAPRVRSVSGDTALARYECARSPLDLGEQPGLVQPGSRISYVPTAALVVRTDVLREVGGFDESLRFGEDVDLIWRLAQHHQVRYEPAATVHHRPRRTWMALIRQRYGYGTSAGPLAVRHGTAVAPARTSLWSAAAWALISTRRIGPALAVIGGSAALLARKLGKTGVPTTESLRLTALGTLGAGRCLADAIGRPWAPIAIPLLATTRSGRRVLTAVALRHLLDWARERPPLDPARWTLARIADDAAYGCGVLRGALKARTATPLLPVLSDVGGRSSVPTAGERS
ncbi:mycofactocin biosynthesis glycosyltransferase MftF [Saccharopolyspora sp. WRP15-2]|uniref:Mycofactocin biosynthesis glycosyltransferase MftF n=1 Tax=Saccharopolyspora oryzae TaxID=2997343 RepID=A0ABT4UR22_9PSEU|nr:mycofactocin biosynthesis glycosyltransferase MftF [Saccharopolyspora oryzae]MDA3624109.1 mycofactocin biosynthesis glycosyltransferase MftF [Saccharopolyspora oryzae]